MINCIHFSTDWLDLSTYNNMHKELNIKSTLGKMYSKIFSLKVIEELANLTEVEILCHCRQLHHLFIIHIQVCTSVIILLMSR